MAFKVLLSLASTSISSLISHHHQFSPSTHQPKQPAYSLYPMSGRQSPPYLGFTGPSFSKLSLRHFPQLLVLALKYISLLHKVPRGALSWHMADLSVWVPFSVPFASTLESLLASSKTRFECLRGIAVGKTAPGHILRRSKALVFLPHLVALAVNSLMV